MVSPVADWRVVYARKTNTVEAVIQEIALIKSGVKIEVVPSKKSIKNCYLCETDCRKGLLAKIKPYGFTMFAKRYGIEALLNCLEENEKIDVMLHRLDQKIERYEEAVETGVLDWSGREK